MDKSQHDERPGIAWPPSLKKTKSRLAIVELLRSATRPLDASELFNALKKQGFKVWLSTVYRNLESLEEAGLIESSLLPDSDSLRYAYRGGSHLHYAVCLGCHKMLPLPSCPLAGVNPFLEHEGFHLSGHKIELYGMCRDCSAEADQV